MDRPRLRHLLDTADARIILLAAPAGYGKTTVARQWLARGARTGCWLQATAASADVASLVVGIVRALADVVDTQDELHRHLKSLGQPAEHVEDLASRIAQAVDPWPTGAWLVIDDYDFIGSSEAADRLVESIVENTTIRVLIAARRRPRWVSARRILYGEICEITQADLALTVEETTAILGVAHQEAATSLWTRTKGWPAVIRLAALSGSLAVPADALPPALHEYFADELFRAASPPVRAALMRVATLPTLTPNLLEHAIGADSAEICQEAAELGFLTGPSAGAFELHPLLRTFLNQKLQTENYSFVEDLVVAVIGEGRWDDAFAMIERFSQFHLLPTLLDRALDALLENGRIATVELWVERAVRLGYEFPLQLVAEAEVLRRRGRFELGEARAQQAAQALSAESSRWTSRAYALAGECAHLDYRPATAIRHHHAAREHAADPADERRAVWGEFIATIPTDSRAGVELLDRFERLSDDAPATLLRLATGRLMLASTQGSVDAAVRRQATTMDLVDRTDDVLITSSVLYRLAYTNVLAGRYRVGLRLARKGEEKARQAGLAFAATHLGAAQAAAALGLRQFTRSETLIERVKEISRNVGDTFELVNAHALEARLHLARAAPEEALDALADWESAPESSGMRAECAGLRAVALAALGDVPAAREFARIAVLNVAEVQPLTLGSLAFAMVEIGRPTADFTQAIQTAVDIVRRRGNYDSFVCAYRSTPSLLGVMRPYFSRQRLETLVRDAHDEDIAASVGWNLVREDGPDVLLTRREKEVYDLVCKGYTNPEIARRLFITEVTVKVHVRHILEKLGVRTRTEAAMLRYEATA